jgi:hypothetical protein
MNKRERMLAIATATAIVVYMGWEFGGISEAFDDMTAEGSTPAARIDLYEEEAELLNRAPKVNQEYQRLVGGSPLAEANSEGLTPDLAASNDIAKWCQSVGFARPELQTSVADLPDTDDFQIVMVTIQIKEGNYLKFAQLMKLLEQKGLILYDVELVAARDSTAMAARLTVGQPVRTFDYTTRKWRNRRA